MSIPGGANPLLLATAAAADAGPFSVTRSLRFGSSASSYLTRTPSSSGDRKKWTLSFWVKLTGKTGHLISAGNDAFQFELRDGGSYLIANSGCFSNQVSDIKLRDYSAWQHFVIEHDASNSYCKIYINGSLQKTITASNANGAFNDSTAHNFNGRSTSLDSFSEFYLAEVHMIDGQALDPTNFGETDSNNNWNPKAYSGSGYGSNGFYLKMADNSSNAALGTDSSGNNNTFTVNNLTADGGVLYSAYGSGTVSGTKTFDKAFDGSTSTFCEPNDDQTITFDFTDLPGGGITVSSSLRIYLNKAGTPGAGDFTVNGTNLGGSVPSDDWLTISSVSLLETITFHHDSGSSSVELYAVEVDGTVLQDGSPFNTDCVIDVPVNSDAGSGNNLGNYCVFNPVSADKSVYSTANGNLVAQNSSVASGSSGSRGRILSSIGFKTGKWYAEVQTTAASDGDVDFAVGIFPVESTGYYSTSGHYAIRPTGHLYSPDGVHQSYGTGAWTDDDIIGIAVDMDSSTKTIEFFKNGTAIASATTIVANEYFFGYGSDGGGGSRTYKSTWNFGAAPFIYAPPSGHKSLCTQNLTDPTIADGSDYFKAALYTGNAGTQSISNLSFSPDLVWIKQRNASNSHFLLDVVRGFSNGNAQELRSNSANAQGVPSTASTGLTSFDSNGFSIGSDSGVNADSGSFVAWAFESGTSTVTNNSDGSITPTGLRASTINGMSIIKYEGTGSNATVGHGLNAAPEFFFGRNLVDTSGNRDWIVYHKALGANSRLKLNNPNAESTSSVFFQDTHPTSSVISIGTSDDINKDDDDYVMYCFTPIPGFSAIGSFTNPSSSIGAFVYCGFRPAFIFAKCARNISSSSGAGDWILKDTSRYPFNDPNDNNTLVANVANAEDNYYAATQASVDILSNGFKIRHTNSSPLGDPGRLYVFFAIAEHPFKTARAR
jgi:hypothetical protein